MGSAKGSRSVPTASEIRGNLRPSQAPLLRGRRCFDGAEGDAAAAAADSAVLCFSVERGRLVVEKGELLKKKRMPFVSTEQQPLKIGCRSNNFGRGVTVIIF